ncbi:hypothetical protein [Rubripirellula reticaptiva]|uniref:Uncharacterized protein n=1 Tax=Rubripirellula reticaptiva TaxID=2528013 RepID=A0A5C6EKN4_9BACT|nr:hypothetical protein [Rubripirellula reticaptiva]TWU48131.1 hypothetical protein Poly59_49760 [Rubripirellula reticaptiva]
MSQPNDMTSRETGFDKASTGNTRPENAYAPDSRFARNQFGPNSGPPNETKNGRCLLFGCVGVFVGGLLLIVCAGFATYSTVRKQVEKYTSTQPMELPTVQYSEEKLTELENRLESFQSTLEVDDSTDQESPGSAESVAASTGEVAAANDTENIASPREIRLSADDINALIAKEEKLRGKVLVRIDDGKVSGDISLPTDSFLPGSKGRYFNGSGTFDVSLEDGVLMVRLVSASVNDEPIPDAFLNGIKDENLAKEIYKNEKNAKIIRRFDSIRVEDDKIIAKLKDGA